MPNKPPKKHAGRGVARKMKKHHHTDTLKKVRSGFGIMRKIGKKHL